MSNSGTHQFRQSGLTLLEIMITVVILSLGLLGLAGLQMTGLKNNRNAYYNTVAAQVVQDIGERLRVDTATRNAIHITSTTDVNGVVTTVNTFKALSGSSAECASGVAYTFDSRVACLAANLPGGQARIAERSAMPKAFYVAVTWTDLELGTNNGWSGATAIAACGATAAGSNCYYNVVMP